MCIDIRDAWYMCGVGDALVRRAPKKLGDSGDIQGEKLGYIVSGSLSQRLLAVGHAAEGQGLAGTKRLVGAWAGWDTSDLEDRARSQSRLVSLTPRALAGPPARTCRS